MGFRLLFYTLLGNNCKDKTICNLNHVKNLFIISNNHLSKGILLSSLRYKDYLPLASSIKKKYEKKFKSLSLYEKLVKFRVLTIPNVLTCGRIMMTPLLSYLIIQEYYISACSCFALAGITDLLDGYIARAYPSQMSDLGSYIDPLADKFLISSLFITLTYVHLIPISLMCLVVTRDAILMASGFYVRYASLDPKPKSLKDYFDPSNRSVALRPTFISKLNTMMQLGLVGATLGAPVFSYVDHQYLHNLWYCAAFTTITSGVSYIFAKDTIKIVRKKRKLSVRQSKLL